MKSDILENLKFEFEKAKEKFEKTWKKIKK